MPPTQPTRRTEIMSTATAATRSQRYRATRRVTVIGGVLDLVLGVLKLIFGYLASSQALISESRPTSLWMPAAKT